jgi:ABC-type phosphate/phosphonate transport system substrate-binding protein
MKKVLITLSFAAAIVIASSCGNDNKPKTDLTEQEQAAVESTIVSDQAQMDSLENTIKAKISDDATEENHDGHNHDGHNHEGHSH